MCKMAHMSWHSSTSTARILCRLGIEKLTSQENRGTDVDCHIPPVSHTCVTYLCHIPVSHTCATYLCHIPVSHTTCVTYLCHIPVSHTCVTYHLCHIPVSHTCATYLCHIPVPHTNLCHIPSSVHLPLMRAETSGNCVTIDICPSIFLPSEVLNP